MSDADADPEADGDDPLARNRLDGEASPYLRQHADNPVNWQPWDDRALAAARERDRPIFLSVGYSACHWCHVMAEESFADPETAAVLNESFVPVKVDREERPDVDSVYQTVCQVVTGRGGWPLSAWLTPDREPFFVGTYFPPEPRGRGGGRGGTPGFRDLCERIADSWADPGDRAEMEDRATQWLAAARDELESVPDADPAPGTGTDVDAADGDGDPGTDSGDAAAADSGADDRDGDGDADPGTDDGAPTPSLSGAADALVRAADREYGGFGTGSGGPKFPNPARLHLLLRAHDRTGEDTYRAVAVEALAAMAEGGLYDHLGGGFHRYSTDRRWAVPHFEKMLYDNAELPRAYLDAYRLTGDRRFRAVARETFGFLDRELRHPGGGFYATLDARSPALDGDEAGHVGADDEAGHDRIDGGDGDPAPFVRADDAHGGEEGRFYVWTPGEVRAAVGEDEDADLFGARYGVEPGGNFEGRTVLARRRSVPDLADEFDLSAGEVRERLARARRAAFEARECRPRAARDEKVIAAWNGLAVSALAEGALALPAEGDSAGADSGRTDATGTDDGDLVPAPFPTPDADRCARLAAEAVDFVRERFWTPAAGSDDGVGRLARRYKDGDVAGPGYLDDYAFLARGALDLYGATGDPRHLGFALELGRALVARFHDADRGTLYYTPEGADGPPVRPQELRDQSTPSSLGVGAEVLASLAAFVPDGDGDDRDGRAGDDIEDGDGAGDGAEDGDGAGDWPDFAAVAADVVATHARRAATRPTEHLTLALATDRVESGPTELTVAVADGDAAAGGDRTGDDGADAEPGDGEDGPLRPAPLPPAWRAGLGGAYVPARVLAPRPGTEAGLRRWTDALGLSAPGPILAGRAARDGTTAYVCRDRTCSPPVTDVGTALEWVTDLAPDGGGDGPGDGPDPEFGA